MYVCDVYVYVIPSTSGVPRGDFSLFFAYKTELLCYTIRYNKKKRKKSRPTECINFGDGDADHLFFGLA